MSGDGWSLDEVAVEFNRVDAVQEIRLVPLVGKLPYEMVANKDRHSL